jgi:ATP-dependent Clp protease ATP-binding subunit ClpX
MEEILTDLMYETPSDNSIERIVITKDVITENVPPFIGRTGEGNQLSFNISKKDAKKRHKRNTAS